MKDHWTSRKACVERQKEKRHEQQNLSKQCCKAQKMELEQEENFIEELVLLTLSSSIEKMVRKAQRKLSWEEVKENRGCETEWIETKTWDGKERRMRS